MESCINMGRRSSTQWEVIRNIFITSFNYTSFNQLSKDYDVSRPAISIRAKDEKWKIQRQEYQNKLLKSKTANMLQAEELIYSRQQAIIDDKNIVKDLKGNLVQAIKQYRDSGVEDSFELGRLVKSHEMIVTIEEKLYGTLIDDLDIDQNEYIFEFGDNKQLCLPKQ